MSIFSAVGSAVGKVAAPLVGGALSAFGVSQQNEASKEAYKHRYQWQVADLRKAGLNPILATSLGAGAGPQVQNVWAPAVSSYWGAQSAQAGVGLSGAQSEAASASAEKSRIEVGKAAAEIQEIAERIRHSEATRVKIAEEVRNLEAGRGLTEMETAKVVEQIPLILAQRAEALAHVAYLHEQGRSVAADAALKEILSDFYTEHPGLYLTKEGASSITSLIGGLLFGRVLGRGK